MLVIISIYIYIYMLDIIDTLNSPDLMKPGAFTSRPGFGS